MATRDELVEAFRASGHQLWLVGGAVRDRILGYEGGDEDFATDAMPDAIQAIAESLGAPVNLVGQRFGTVGALIDGRWTEITTFRGDTYDGGGRWPEVTFGATIEEDLARRDFSINAIAESTSGERVDPFGGERDIEAGIIRAVGDPAARFREDPLRILRGLRFVSQLGFAIEPSTLEGMTATAALLSTLSQERVTTELDRLLQGREPGTALDLLRATGALAVVLPELAPMVGCEQNRFHRFDVWGHTVATVAAIDPGDDARIRRWTAFLHDLGKPAVRHVKANGEWGFYGHEVAGGAMAADLLERLRFGRADAKVVVMLVRRHMDRPVPSEGRSVRRFMQRSGGHWRDLVALKRADNASHTYDDSEYHDELEAACAAVEVNEADRLRARSPLSGDDLLAMFGGEPGPWLRRIKDRLSAMVLDGELEPGDREGATRIAQSLIGEARKS